MHQLVIRRPQPRIARKRPKPRPIDQRLRMLNPHPDRKRLGHHRHPPRVKHRKRVARRMPHSQHHMLSSDPLPPLQHHAPNAMPLIQLQIDHLALPAILPAQRLDPRPHMLHHRDQPKRPDMRLGHPQDLLRRPRPDKLLQHLPPAMPGVLDLRIQLAVRKRPRAALAKLHIGFRLQHPPPPQPPSVLRPLPHHPTAIQHNRPEPHLRQHQSRKQPARPRPDHHRPPPPRSRRPPHKPIGRIRRQPDMPIADMPRQHPSLVIHLDIQRIAEPDRRPVARIMRPARHMHRAHRPQPRLRGLPQRVLIMVQLQAQFGQADHARDIRQAGRARKILLFLKKKKQKDFHPLAPRLPTSTRPNG